MMSLPEVIVMPVSSSISMDTAFADALSVSSLVADSFTPLVVNLIILSLFVSTFSSGFCMSGWPVFT